MAPRPGWDESVPRSRRRALSDSITPLTRHEFIAKWQRAKLSKRSAAPQHVLDVCELLGQPKSAAADPDGRRLASSGEDGSLRIWAANSDAELFALRGHTGGVNGVAFRPDGGLLASAGDNRTVQL